MKQALFASIAAASIVMVLAATAQDPGIEGAKRVLEASVQAYRSAPALRDKLSYVVMVPGSEQETKTEEYSFGPNGTVLVPTPRLVAAAERMVAKYKSLPLGLERDEDLATHAMPMIEFHTVPSTNGTLLLLNCHVRE